MPDFVCNPEINQLRSMQNALDLTIGALLTSPTRNDPTVGERRHDLDKAIGLLDGVDELVDRAGYGLRGKGYVDDLVSVTREAMLRLRKELQ